jgi:hypothetical protein
MLEEVLKSNPDFDQMKIISQSVNENPGFSSVIEYFKYALVISCDAERTFSQYKAFFRSNRPFKENLTLMFLTHCNLNKLQ